MLNSPSTSAAGSPIGRRSVKESIKAGLRSLHKTTTPATFADVVTASCQFPSSRPSRHQGTTANSSVMPYLILIQDGDNMELTGSADGLAASHLFSKFGLSESTATKKNQVDLKRVKSDYFTLLERSGFLLVSSTACPCDGHVQREYVFRKQEAMKRLSLDEVTHGWKFTNKLSVKPSSALDTLGACRDSEDDQAASYDSSPATSSSSSPSFLSANDTSMFSLPKGAMQASSSSATVATTIDGQAILSAPSSATLRTTLGTDTPPVLQD
eukprot:scpid65738/ scgid14069/ 